MNFNLGKDGTQSINCKNIEDIEELNSNNNNKNKLKHRNTTSLNKCKKADIKNEKLNRQQKIDAVPICNLENKNLSKSNVEITASNLSCIYLNARSIVNKMDELRLLANEIKPDVIGIVETWLNSEIKDNEINIDEYNFVRKDRTNNQKSRGGGVIIYVSNSLKFIDTTSALSSNIDHIWIKVLYTHSKSINVGLFYRPQDTSDDEIKFLITNLTRVKTENTIVLGDFNYGDINWKKLTSGTLGKKFLKEVMNAGLHQCVKGKTRGLNILDLVLVYEKSLIQKVDILAPLGKSDHNVLKVQVNILLKKPVKNITLYKYKKANYNILKELLEEVDWDKKLSTNSVNDVWEFLKTMLKDFKDKHIPSIIKNVNKDAPWMNKKVKKLIKKRNNLFKRYKRSCQNYVKIRYTVMRNLVTKQIRLAKRKYEEKIIKRSKNNRKVFYAYCNGLKIDPLKLDHSRTRMVKLL